MLFLLYTSLEHIPHRMPSEINFRSSSLYPNPNPQEQLAIAIIKNLSLGF
jgi:hypothetical protein